MIKTLLWASLAGLVLGGCKHTLTEGADPGPDQDVYSPYGDPGFREGDGAKKDDAQFAPLRDLGYDIEALQADEAQARRLITLSKYLGHEREAWQKPDEVIQTLGVRPGQTVADIGSASGYFAWYLSEAVASHGQVLAVDVDELACDFIQRRLEHQPPPHGNIRVVQSHPEHVALGLSSVDHAFLVDAEFFIVHDDTTRSCLKSLFLAMKPAGKVAVIESVDKSERGSIKEAYLLDPFEEAGFVHVETHDLLKHSSHGRPGGQHFMVFWKPEEPQDEAG